MKLASFEVLNWSPSGPSPVTSRRSWGWGGVAGTAGRAGGGGRGRGDGDSVLLEVPSSSKFLQSQTTQSPTVQVD